MTESKREIRTEIYSKTEEGQIAAPFTALEDGTNRTIDWHTTKPIRNEFGRQIGTEYQGTLQTPSE